MTKIASLMNDHLFFSLPISQDYGREQWRADLRHLIKTAGSEDRDVVILLPATQLLKRHFLAQDIDSLFSRHVIVLNFWFMARHGSVARNAEPCHAAPSPN